MSLLTLCGVETFTAPRDAIYQALVNPRDQLAWNTLYQGIETVSDDPIRTGSVFTGRFKGSGRVSVTFEDVAPGVHFTHSTALIAGGLVLGVFRHTFALADGERGVEVTQTVAVALTGWGRLMSPVIRAAFRRRLPESFAELRAHLDGLSKLFLDLQVVRRDFLNPARTQF